MRDLCSKTGSLDRNYGKKIVYFEEKMLFYNDSSNINKSSCKLECT